MRNISYILFLFTDIYLYLDKFMRKVYKRGNNMNLENFKRQHKDVYECIDNINNLIMKNNLDEHATELSKSINNLAGKLQIHLQSEDKFLYPRLLKEEKTKDIAQMYIDEMGNILSEFIEYKNKFNTKNKIEVDKNAFIRETSKMLNLIKNRMNKEDNNLYILI